MMNKEGKGLPLLYKRCTLFTICDLVWWWGGGCGAAAAGVHGREEGLSSGYHVRCEVLLF